MSNTAVPAIQFTPTGPVLPQEADILAGVQADQLAAFGANLNPSLETPQGQLASALTQIIANKNDQIALIVNQVDPDTAADRWQDAIGRIYFLDRLPATSTTVAVLCTGSAGVVIPVGARVTATDGTIYACTDGGTIPIAGNITLTFAANVTGPIVCAIGMIATIYQAIPGWDSVTNVAAGVLGSDVESRADFEYRRKQSVAINAIGSLPSIYANVFDVNNVTDVYVAENTTNANITNGSITLLPHSIYVAAVGGLAADIATAIWKKKSVGADYNGNTSVTVTDPSGYSVPLPSYVVKFQIPPAIAIKFAVQIANTTGLPSNIIALVQAAILDGGDGGPRARIGSTLFASRFYAPVSNIKSGYVEILSLLLGTTSPTLPAITIDIGRAPTLQVSDIVVAII